MSSSLYVYANITHKKRKVNSRRRKFKKRKKEHKISHLEQKNPAGALRLGYGDLQPPEVRDMHAYTMR